MAALNDLSDADIRSKLIELGCEVGPVTPFTRKVYQKKLQSLLDSGCSNDSEPTRDNASSFEESIFKNRIKSPVQSKAALKSPARSSDVHPLASSTFVDTNSPARPNILKGSIRSENLRSTNVRRDVTPPEKRVSSSTNLPSPAEDLTSFRTSYNLNSLPSNNGTSGSKYNSPYLSGGNTFRSKLSDYDPDQPYASDFTRRLSSSSYSRIAAQTNTSARSQLLNSKIYDSVKESDDEEDNSGPISSSKFGTSSRGPQSQRGSGHGYPSAGSWLGRDASVYILGFLALFFLVVAYIYIHMHHSDSPVTPYVSELSYPRCAGDGGSQNCIPDHEIKQASAVFKLICAELYDLSAKSSCSDGSVLKISNEEASRIINIKIASMSVYELDSYIYYAGILANSNPSKNVVYSVSDGFILGEVPPSLFCSIINQTMSLSVWLIRIGLGAIGATSIYWGSKWWMARKSKHQEEVSKMLSQIIDSVSSSATNDGPGFAVISHIRDRFIPPMDKSSKMKLWDEAVALLGTDSRIRTEVQQVEGEDFLVWRWLAPPPNPKKKVWQGQAFETMDGSVNSLLESPTACLKIRHMFDPSKEEGDNWVTAVADAVLEKCKDACICHIVVEKQSPEGCVYVKCASPRDAGIAYRALHGFWFDSKLVTVKYIREPRYLERFPDSARAKYPLIPSSKRQNK